MAESNYECLQMAFYATSDKVGPEELFPILLVFDAVPRPARKLPAATKIEHGKSIVTGMKTVETLQTRLRL